MSNYDVIIIGSGPAGLTAGVYSARASLRTLILAGQEFGGQLMGTTLVENFPGFSEGVMGPELMSNMVKQAQNQGAELIYKYADKVELEGDVKKVWADGVEYSSKVVIVASGSSPRKLNIPGEVEYWGKGVSTCATCDGAFYREKTIAVIGGGDSAAEEATFLTRFASKVYLVHRREELRASKAMQERVFRNDKIEVLWNKEVRAVLGTDIVTGVTLYDNKTDSTADLSVDGVFLAIGHLPNTSFLEGALDVDEQGFIIAKDHTETSIDGVFVCGDVNDHKYQQAITAAGMGCMASLDAEKWLATREE